MTHKVLIVDDDHSILEVLDARLSASNFVVIKANDADSAVRILKREQVDLMVSDIKMPQKSGIELFSEIQQTSPDLPVIFLTAYGTIPDAVKAIKMGAVDYISKPFNGVNLIKKINSVLTITGKTPPAKMPRGFDNGYYWGSSAVMKDLYQMVARVAASDVSVLILGESGVGKERIARYIHERSKRAKNPYIIVDCGSTPAGLLESELFGHRKGAFTHAVSDKQGLIQASDSGTLFLDEIGNISHDMQCRLLRFLEDGKVRQVGAVRESQVDSRLLAATNADLPAAIEEGSFRNDLYYRIKGVTLTIPPLRDRQEDIPVLAQHFTEQYAKDQGIEPPTISESAMKVLLEHPWPGNIRELKHIIEAGTVLCRDNSIEPWDLQVESIRKDAAVVTDTGNEFSIEESEKQTIIRALAKSKGVQKEAADLLGISKRAIHYKIRKYDIDPLAYK